MTISTVLLYLFPPSGLHIILHLSNEERIHLVLYFVDFGLFIQNNCNFIFSFLFQNWTASSSKKHKCVPCWQCNNLLEKHNLSTSLIKHIKAELRLASLYIGWLDGCNALIGLSSQESNTHTLIMRSFRNVCKVCVNVAPFFLNW